MLLCLAGSVLGACKSSGEKLMPVAGNEPVVGTVKTAPRVIVYKTTKDYSRNVAVTLSADRKSIVSYPAPSDLTEASVPQKLDGGYLLDRRGVSEYTAYLSYTIDEYASLDKAPAMDELQSRIIDYNPIVEMWDCGSQYEIGGADLQGSLNKIISSGFKGCTKIK